MNEQKALPGPFGASFTTTVHTVPCVNLPYFLGANGLPVGIQVIGPQNKDKQLLSYCNEIENKMKNYFGKLPVSTIN